MQRALLWVLFAALLAVTRVAHAHDPFEVTTVAKLREDGLELVVTMTRRTALSLAARRPGGPDFNALAPELYDVRAAQKPLVARAVRVDLAGGEVAFHVDYEPPPSGPLRFVAMHVRALGEGYTSTLEVSRDAPVPSSGFKVLTAEDSTYEAALERQTPETGTDSSGASATMTSAGAFFVLGLEHILEGYDHLLFLAGLLIASTTLRSTVRLITAFTLSHSITLVLAALGWVAAPVAIVEAVIAASIVVVGIENVWLKQEPRHRVALVFTFGLIHGLGFAGALQNAGLGAGSNLLGSVVAFNLGVEAGQIALALVALPLLWNARKARLGAGALVAASIAISLVGAYLLVDRSLLA